MFFKFLVLAFFLSISFLGMAREDNIQESCSNDFSEPSFLKGVRAEDLFSHYRANTDFVSLWHLISEPQDYSGKKISVIGVLGYDENEHSPLNPVRLYVDVSSRERSVIRNAINIDTSHTSMETIKSFDGRYVRLVGVFRCEEGEVYRAGWIVGVPPLGSWSDAEGL